MLRRWFWVAVALLAACGGGEDLTKARIRLVNASAYAALDMTVDEVRLFSSVAYGDSASYVDADPAKMATTISRPNSATPLLSFTPTVKKDQSYTVLAYGDEGKLQQVVLDDNTGEPASGKALLRVVNGDADAGDLDVFLTGAGEDLADAVPLQAAAKYGALGAHVSVNAATWRLQVTGANNKGDVRLDVPAVTLADRQVATLVITRGRGGVLVNALLLVDRGAVDRVDNLQARVRVAAGVPAGGSVSASVGAKIVMNAVGAPAVGLYTLVAASAAPVVSASVNGKPATGVIGPLVAGGDYTLLVYGPLATPQMSLIEDDNHRPERAEGARLRLVHGVADLTDTLSLTADFVPIASGTKQAEGSPYANLDSSVNATLIATTPGVVEPVCTASDKIFVAASTYSLFVVGNSKDANGNRQPAVCILRQDR